MVWFLLPSARFPHPLPLNDLIAICLQLFIDYAGIIGNVAILLAIMFRSPVSWRSFKILLAKQAMVDLVATVSCSFIIERMIPTPIGTAMVYLGPCVLVSPFSCHIGHSIMINTQTYSIHVSPSPRTMVIICTFMMTLPICVFILTLLTIDDESEVRTAFRDYNLDDYVIQGHLISHARLAHKISALYNAGSALPVTASVFVLRRNVLAVLEHQKSKMSSKSLRIHWTLVKVLTLQACLPALHTLTIACYLIEKRGLFHSQVTQHTIRVAVSLMTAVSPYISIINIETYRDFILCRAERRSVQFSLATITTK